MKKLICLLFVIMIACTSCNDTPASQKSAKYEDNTTLNYRRFTLDGHTYIEFFRGCIGYDNYTGYVHDPDCPCNRKK